MALYSFNIRKHIRDDMYKNETIELELSDSEIIKLNNDDGKYSKNSAFLSAKLGEKVEVNGLPKKICQKIKKMRNQIKNLFGNHGGLFRLNCFGG